MGVFAQSTKQYMVSKKDLKTNKIRIAIQCIIRESLTFTGLFQLRDNLSIKIVSLDLNADGKLKENKEDENI